MCVCVYVYIYLTNRGQSSVSFFFFFFFLIGRIVLFYGDQVTELVLTKLPVVQSLIIKSAPLLGFIVRTHIIVFCVHSLCVKERACALHPSIIHLFIIICHQ